MTRFFVRHPVTTWMLFTAFIVLGLYAVPRLKIEALPEVDLPSLTVVSTWQGASPEAVQRSITVPLEDAIHKVKGIESIRSTSRAGLSRISIEFRQGTDLDFARLDINEQLGAVRKDLPFGASQPQISSFVPQEFRTEEFFAFDLESALPPNELRDQAESWVLPQVLSVEGVADAEVRGGARPLIKILLNRRLLELYEITGDEVFARLDELDALSGAGTVYQDGLEKLVALRTPVDVAALENAIVAQRGARSYRLSMLGEVRPDYEDLQAVVRGNAQNVVQIVVEKRSNSNSVLVSQALRKALPEIQEKIPFEASFHISTDEGKDLEEKLWELVYRSLIILGVLFLMLAISLRQIRPTIVVVASILLAIVISLSLFYFGNISVNFITISGLTVCFGLILDNSILVLDAVARKLNVLKRSATAELTRAAKLRVAVESIVLGTREVMFPILATTLTTVVAFMSFIFLSGRLALYYVPLAVAVAMAMFGSLLVAFAWIPVVLNRGWAQGLVDSTPTGTRDVTDPASLSRYAAEQADIESPLSRTERLFDWLQRGWWIVLPATIGLLAWCFFDVYPHKVIKGGFWQMPNQEELLVYMEMPPGTDVAVVSETLNKFEAALVPIPEGVRASSTAWEGRAFMRVEFDEDMLQTHYPTMYRQYLVEVGDATGGSSIFIRGFADQPYIKGSFGGSALNSLIEVSGYNSRTLNRIAEDALAVIQRQRRVRNARITTGDRWERATNEETVITIDRKKLADHGLTVLGTVGYVRRLLGVDLPWTMLVDGDQERVLLSFDDSDTIEFADVAAKVIPSPTGDKVKLGEIISLEMKPLPGPVVREDQRYTVSLNWEYIGTDRMRSAYLKSVLNSLDLPYGYDAKEGEQEFFTQEEEEDLTLMVWLAVAFIFMVLAALFESMTIPFLVILALPLALVGVFITFWLTDTTFDSSARIGLVLLFGIVVNNAILLVSRFRTEASLILKAKLGGDPEAEGGLFSSTRKQLGGSDLMQLPKAERAPLLRRAVARAARVKLRPILLTSGTTLAGMAPLLIKFQEKEGKDIWENLALASIGGLASSTILILLFIPTLYAFVVLRRHRLIHGALAGLFAGALGLAALVWKAGTWDFLMTESSGPAAVTTHLMLLIVGVLIGMVMGWMPGRWMRGFKSGPPLGVVFGLMLWMLGSFTLAPMLEGMFTLEDVKSPEHMTQLFDVLKQPFWETGGEESVAPKLLLWRLLGYAGLGLLMGVAFCIRLPKREPQDEPVAMPLDGPQLSGA